MAKKSSGNNSRKKKANNLKYTSPLGSERINISKRLTKKCHQMALRAFVEKKKKSPRKNKADTNPEKQVCQILERHGFRFIREYQLYGKFFDFFVYSKEGEELCLIETDGVYWHGKDEASLTIWQIKQRIEDQYKNSIAAINKIPLLRIWEDEIDENAIVEYLQEIERQKEELRNI